MQFFTYIRYWFFLSIDNWYLFNKTNCFLEIFCKVSELCITICETYYKYIKICVTFFIRERAVGMSVIQSQWIKYVGNSYTSMFYAVGTNTSLIYFRFVWSRQSFSTARMNTDVLCINILICAVMRVYKLVNDNLYTFNAFSPSTSAWFN